MINRLFPIKNLFPEDTRLAEICSAITLMFISFLMGSQLSHSLILYSIERMEFWVALFFSFGFIQFISLMFYPKLELLRCTMSIICGCILIWLSLGSLNMIIELSDVGIFALGLANLYAFVINTAQIRNTWEK